MKLKLFLLISVLSVHSFAQTVHTVDNRQYSGAMFTDLQTAINTALAGDIIQVHPSPTSYGNITVDKQLKLVGLGHDPIVHTQGFRCTVGTISFASNSANSILTGLNTATITVLGGSVNLDNIQIIHNRIFRVSSSLGNSWIIEGNYIYSTGNAITTTRDSWIIKNNIFLGGVSNLNPTCVVSNNIFISTTGSAWDTFISNCDSTQISNNIFIASNANMVEFRIVNSPFIDMRKNLSYNYGGGTILDFPEGDPLNPSNMNNVNPNFVNVPAASIADFYNNDYHLTNPILGTDATTNIGIHGLNFAFDHKGRPDLQPYMIDVIINNNIIAPGQNLSVKFTAAQKQ